MCRHFESNRHVQKPKPHFWWSYLKSPNRRMTGWVLDGYHLYRIPLSLWGCKCSPQTWRMPPVTLPGHHTNAIFWYMSYYQGWPRMKRQLGSWRKSCHQCVWRRKWAVTGNLQDIPWSRKYQLLGIYSMNQYQNSNLILDLWNLKSQRKLVSKRLWRFCPLLCASEPDFQYYTWLLMDREAVLCCTSQAVKEGFALKEACLHGLDRCSHHNFDSQK